MEVVFGRGVWPFQRSCGRFMVSGAHAPHRVSRSISSPLGSSKEAFALLLSSRQPDVITINNTWFCRVFRVFRRLDFTCAEVGAVGSEMLSHLPIGWIP